MLSLLTHPHIVLNLYEFMSYAEHKIIYFAECCNQTVDAGHVQDCLINPACVNLPKGLVCVVWV